MHRARVGAGPQAAAAAVAVVARLGAAHGRTPHLTVCPVHHLDKLSALEREQQVGTSLQ